MIEEQWLKQKLRNWCTFDAFLNGLICVGILLTFENPLVVPAVIFVALFIVDIFAIYAVENRNICGIWAWQATFGIFLLIFSGLLTFSFFAFLSLASWSVSIVF